MLVVFHAIDRPNSGDLRATTRAAHLEFQSARNNLFGGPLLDRNGDACGTLIIFEAPDIETATAELADDPYLVAGLFEHVSITEFAGIVSDTRPHHG
ncbi:MAG: YciI family protein [Ilumatobacter sp.]|uniref:YciI family protein n=1 Tax=Ilumatobacter sp. TaxID=1967498 RepID=UPI0039189A27